MKYLKKFEKNINEPKVGDYVICTEFEHESYPQSLYDFVHNNAGLVVKKYQPKYSPVTLDVKYKNTPTELKSQYFFREGSRPFAIYQVVEFGSTPEIVFAKLAAKKYNI